MTVWESRAMFAEKEYGAYVDWKERYFICPFCGEMVAEDDWPEGVFGEFICPICEDIDF